jgi:hypothetical protein
MSIETAFDELRAQLGVELPALVNARATTLRRIGVRQALLRDLDGVDPDTAIVLMGSWGRREVTSGSDDDFVVLVHGEPREAVHPTVPEVSELFARDPEGFEPPGPQNVFADVVFSSDLVRKIGLDEDTNRNLTRRMLLVLESVALTNGQRHAAVRRDILDEYLADTIKPHRPPRFLLNDVVRYWRTLGVDFAAKVRERDGEGWGLRNAKLRTSRKVLFAAGLLPVLRCHEHDSDGMASFLAAQFDHPPVDRLADAFLRYDALAAAEQAFVGYDAFLALLDDPSARASLKAMGLPPTKPVPEFESAARFGRGLDSSLLTLLFETELAPFAREFGIL